MQELENAALPQLTVHAEDVTITLNEGETVLEGLYRNGYAYRIGCRRGGCGICKVDLLSGDVTYNRVVADTVLTDEERASGTCLTCRAVPTTDIEIQLRDEHLKKVGGLLAFAMRASAESTKSANNRTTKEEIS